MMGTLAAALAKDKIRTWEDLYHADVEGDIEDVGGVLKITKIRVTYYLTLEEEQHSAAREAFSSYLISCPAAQSVINCIDIKDDLMLSVPTES
jgi:organic hydroperoxide reductase OsmC/OhrA